MSDVVSQFIYSVCDRVVDPYLGQSLLALNAVNDIEYESRKVKLSLQLGYPGKQIQQRISEKLSALILEHNDIDHVVIDTYWQSPMNLELSEPQTLSKVRNIVAVASGKGGVGKSTTTANLALALAHLGAKVGILDADIYGPSQQLMLGLDAKRPEIVNANSMLPNESYGIKSMSMGYLVSEKTPMVWRGPMATGALQQLLFQTDWQELDYLLVDMPPGTGDIQLTLSQKVPVSGAVIVTTPQDIALLDAKKGVEMFAKVDIPVLGVVENMSLHQCSQCGHTEHIFGSGGGERIARDYNTVLLGALPLDLSIREDADSGKPSVVSNPKSSISQTYIETAQHLAARLWVQQSAAPEIVISDD